MLKVFVEGHQRADASPLVIARNAVVKALILEIVSSCVLWAWSWRRQTGRPPPVSGAPSLPSHVMTNHLFVLLQLLSDVHPMVQRAAKEALRSLSVSQGNAIGNILLETFLHCRVFSINIIAVIIAVNASRLHKSNYKKTRIDDWTFLTAFIQVNTWWVCYCARMSII